MKLSKGTLLTIAFLVFIVYISWTMILSGSNYQCEICVRFNNKEQCQVVEGAEEADTIMQGISTACGGVANGMSESINCQQKPPTKKVCKKLQ